MKRAVPYAALLICLGCGYLGYFASARIFYHYDQSNWFRSTKKQDADWLREIGQTTFAIEGSSMAIQNTPSSIQNNLKYLAKIRTKAPPELSPILDLRLAKDYAMMARLEQLAGNSTAAATHQQSAKELLHLLGWTDISDGAVTDLASAQLRSRLKR